MHDNWPFADAPDTACITTRQVLEEGYPILLVTRDSEDGMWQILCGTTSNTDDARVIGLGEALKIDPSLAQIADLPLGWRAWRENRESTWQKAPRSE
jgi:hypothetical protein